MEHKNHQLITQLNSELANTNSIKQLDLIYLKYLGKSGLVNKLAGEIKNLPNDKKAEFGKTLNLIKTEVDKIINNKKLSLVKKSQTKEFKDYSTIKNTSSLGSLHPVTHAVWEIEDIFNKLGFVRKSYREVDNDWYPFEGLNMPQNHPARDEWETFFVQDGKFVLTPHTSNGQLREMESKKLPIKMLNIATTYRRQISAKHSPMFHQFEGMYIDKNVSIAHLKGTLDYFVKAFFGANRQTRIRPYHFKFTEPSFEVDVTCNKCNGKGCKVCKAGWLEIGGAGMIHPTVLKNGGIDSKKYSGFAFGFGVERPYMMKGSINIPDIRYFYSTNLDFLKNF